MNTLAPLAVKGARYYARCAVDCAAEDDREWAAFFVDAEHGSWVEAVEGLLAWARLWEVER
jgi:hypothetical protein